MVLSDSNMYQFKVSLKEVKPKIWRRVQVPENFTFWDMHVAIQDLMPWEDCHLHQFEVANRTTGEKDLIGTVDSAMGVTVNEREAKLKDYFVAPKDKGTYLYDFGIGWLHEVVLERILPARAGTRYPCCASGRNPCFPEDAQGDRPEVEFDPRLVRFRDPEQHWDSWFNNPAAKF